MRVQEIDSFLDMHRRIYATGRVQIKWRQLDASLTLRATRCVHSSMNIIKMKYVLLYLHYFKTDVQILKLSENETPSVSDLDLHCMLRFQFWDAKHECFFFFNLLRDYIPCRRYCRGLYDIYFFGPRGGFFNPNSLNWFASWAYASKFWILPMFETLASQARSVLDDI